MKLKKNIAVSESGFVFDPTTGDSFSLNPIGLIILEQLQKTASVDDIITLIEEDYDAEKSVIERNVMDFISMLEQYNLLEYEQN